MAVKVNKELCIGCGACVSLCPDVFRIGSDGKSEAYNPKGCKKCDCKAAAENCPVHAISL